MKKNIKWIVLGTFIIMVLVNALANILPINGVSTGAVSDSYFNLFAPVGFTFAVWGVIYLMLLVYVIYQLGFIKTDQTDLMNTIGIVFAITNVVNTIWIFMWHYRQILLSLILMLLILVGLIIINLKVKKANLKGIERLVIKQPFSIYFGWITVATIANVTTYLVDIGFDGFGLPESLWTCVILLVGAGIASLTIIRQVDIVYGLVILWAYFGIFYKHISKDFFDLEYASVAIFAGISMMIVVFVMVRTFMVNTFVEKEKNEV